MLPLVLRRLAQAVPILFLISVLSFAFVRAAPGDPVSLVLNPDQLSAASEEQLSRIRSQLGLDQPLPVQYVRMMTSMATGELRSFRSRESSLAMVAAALPTTISLTIGALALAWLIGIPLGIASALRPYSTLDHLLSTTSLFGISVPNFWLGVVLVLIFAEWLRLLPSTGIRPADATSYRLDQMLPHLVLPLSVMSSGIWASFARYIRAGMLDVLGQDYVRTATAKGLPARCVIFEHALRNALLPVVSLSAVLVPILFGSAVVIESVFALPGVGRLAATSALTRDYPVVLTINMITAIIVLITSICTDVVYSILDPRLRVE